MAYGIPPNLGNINQNAGQIALNFRNNLQQILWFNNYLVSLGNAGLVAAGFTSADATALMTLYANLATIAIACQGGSYTGPALPHNFVSDTTPTWGGQ